ncbi:MAG TPA: hypothetical protein EYG86_03065 [Crocinitomicaceae bacterium]|nr:hypothetical protein [Crocinitomicaceae bacterium]
MSKIRLQFIVFLFAFFVQSDVCFSQSDSFENYSALQSKGKIPDVFIQSTQTKVENALAKGRSGMSEEEELIFLERIHFSIDELLQSGLILYGDATTKYVEKVAENLLKDSRKLKKELQFFVLKSNVTNALSTDQGLIFVTLGLLSQLENEAQLAYVLSHEIAHYTESHVEEAYQERMNTERGTSYDDRITRMSNHSKENEFEADLKGIKLFNEAGYDKNELLSAFDVMAYSYLPFDEEPFKHEYYQTDLLYIPSIYYPEVINSIKIDEDYDDTKSSHPNIRKRKDAVIDELQEYTSWGDKKFIFEKNEFEKVRNLARFEGLRIDLFNHRFADAIYSVYLLEKKFPNNEYIQTVKAQAWLGLTRFKIAGNYSKAVKNPKKVEGESHAVFYLLKKLSKVQLMTVSMRNIEDAYSSFSNNEEIKEVREAMIKHLAEYSRFKMTEYSTENYQSALEAFNLSKLELNDTTSETVEFSDSTKTEGLSKYDKIKRKRNVTIAVTEEEEFDEKKFHLFALSDLIKDEEFKRKYRKHKDAENEAIEDEDGKVNVKELVVLEPMFLSADKQGINVKKSEELETNLIKSIKKMSKRFDVTVYDQSNVDIESQNTEQFNTKSVFLNFLRQRAEYGDSEMFPVDYLALKELKEQFGDAKMMFIYGEHYRNPVKPGMAILGILFPPIGIPYFASKLVTGNRINISYSILDLETGELNQFIDYNFNMKPKEGNLDAIHYKLMSELTGSKPIRK